MEKLNFEIEQTDVVDEGCNSQFATAKVRIFSSGESRNDTYCSEEALKETAKTIDNKPLVYNISKVFGDFSSHNSPEDTLIAGFAVPGSQEFERLPDNRLSLSVLVKLWKRYAPIAMDIFKRDGGKKKVSVEVDLLDSEENENGIRNMKNFAYNAICILGDLVTEASPGAQLEILSFAEENKKYKEAVAVEFGSYDDVDFTIPDEVKKNVSKGLELYKQYNNGATSVSLASARYIMKNEKVTPERIRHISKTHRSNKFKNIKKSPPNEEFISYMLYGGKDGMEWSEKISKDLDDQDEKYLSYFNEIITFPYKSKSEMNPALKGIDPPISLSQANEIARQADAIGTDKDKNGWAIAIANFKKTHVVKNGIWVKRSENMEKFSEKEEDPKEEEKKEFEESEVKEEEKKEFEEGKEEEKKEFEEGEDKEEKKEESEGEKKEEDKEEEKMSLDQNLDVAAFLAMLTNETDAYSNLIKEEFEKEDKNFAKIFEAMCGKMCKMEEEKKEFLSYKKEIEDNKFKFAVESTIKDIESHSNIPQDKKEYLIEESKKFNLENIEAWKNFAKAEAFEFAKKEEKDDSELKIGNPWETFSKKDKKSVWDSIE